SRVASKRLARDLAESPRRDGRPASSSAPRAACACAAACCAAGGAAALLLLLGRFDGGAEDVELLLVERAARASHDALANALLEALKDGGFFAHHEVDDLGVRLHDDDGLHELRCLAFEGAEDVVSHRPLALERAAAFAIPARLRELSPERLARALSRHL